MKIVDGHSHFGEDLFWKNSGNMQEYIRNACFQKNVREVYLMSVPCPVIRTNNENKEILLYYDIKGNIIKYYKVFVKNNEKQYVEIKKNANPYKLANDNIYLLSKNKEIDLKINYVPLIHPYFYSIEDFIENKNKGAKMFKIHGIACGVDPMKIEERFFAILEEIGLPLLIHIDFSEQDNLLSKNSALNWINRLQKYNIKVYFAHAVRLSDYATRIVNNDDRYYIGIGPDKLLNIKGQNEFSPDDYLKYCFEKFNINKIIFDYDYPWNIQSYDNNDFDWNSSDRIDSILSQDEREKIYKYNIKRLCK